MKRLLLSFLVVLATSSIVRADDETIDYDITSRFGVLTNWQNWVGAMGLTATNYCPLVTTNTGERLQVCERYSQSCHYTGNILYQHLSGLQAGVYKIELYANAAYTYGRGFSSEAFTDDGYNMDGEQTNCITENTGVSIYASTSNGYYAQEIPVYYALDFASGPDVVVLENVVVGDDGELELGMSKESYATNWHIIQLKGVSIAVAPDNIPEEADPVVSEADLQVNPLEGMVGSEVTLPVNLQNVGDMTAIYFHLTLPRGVSVVDIVPTDRMKDGAVCQYSRSTHKCLFYNYTFAGEVLPFNGNDGSVANIILNIGKEVKPGDHVVYFNKIEVLAANGKTLNVDDFFTTLSVAASDQPIEEPTGETELVTIKDITLLIDKYLHQDSSEEMPVAAVSSCSDSHHPHMIDLGLPSGTLWACCNVDAKAPQESGGYFSWGECSEKDSYTTFAYIERTEVTDETDVAYIKSGGTRCMPTEDQISELLENCTWEWITYEGVNGALVTGPNGNIMFLPAADFQDGEWKHEYYGLYGSYWARTYYGFRYYNGASYPCGTELIFGLVDGNEGFTQSSFYYTYGNTGWCYCGRSVRPVAVVQ